MTPAASREAAGVGVLPEGTEMGSVPDDEWSEMVSAERDAAIEERNDLADRLGNCSASWDDLKQKHERLRAAGRAVVLAAVPGSVQHVPECGPINAVCSGCRLRVALAAFVDAIGGVPPDLT